MWALLPASHTHDIISKTAEAQRARHSFKALCSQMTLSSKMKLLLLGNWSSVFGDGTRLQISIVISHLNEEHFSGICQREAKASLFLVTQCTMFAQWRNSKHCTICFTHAALWGLSTSRCPPASLFLSKENHKSEKFSDSWDHVRGYKREMRQPWPFRYIAVLITSKFSAFKS